MSRAAIATMPGPFAGVGIEQGGEALAYAPSIGIETELAHAVHTGSPDTAAEAIGIVEAPDRGVIQKVADKMAGTSLGRKVLGSAVGLMGAGMAVGPAVASAHEGGSSTTTIVNTETGVTTRGSHAWAKDGDHSHVTVMGNHRIVSKTEVRQMEEDGQCETFNGKKVKIYTEGHNTGGTAFGRDKRKSEFCRTDEDFNGDGKADWIRALCGNAAIIGVTPAGAIEQVIWVEGKGKLPIHAHSKVTAKADCATSDGLTSASAYAEGEASASGFIMLKGGTKTMVKKAQNKVDSIVKQSITGKGGAQSKAFAIADAQCSEGSAPTPPPPTTPPNTGKDGVPGAGSGSGGGQPDGPGAPGQPGQGSGGECLNDQGDLVPGPADQNGYC